MPCTLLVYSLIFQQLFHSFTLLDRPSSPSLLPPQPSFLLIPPSSLSLLPPRPLFSRDAATLYERVSVRWLVRWSVGRSVTLSFFGLLVY